MPHEGNKASLYSAPESELTTEQELAEVEANLAVIEAAYGASIAYPYVVRRRQKITDLGG